jgi:hypothetical protein
MLTSRQIFFAVTGERPPRRSPRRPTGRGPARNWKYKGWIRSLPSAVSGAHGCEAAHTGNDGGMAQRASDYSCIPLTHDEHMELHRIGREAFETRYDINLAAVVRSLQHCWFAYSGLTK